MLYLLILFLLLYAAALIRVARKGDSLILAPFDPQETMPLRGMLALAVWLTHLCPYLVGEMPGLVDFCLWGPPSVACFFLLTGYGLAVSYQRKGRDYLQGFFRRRMLRLLWPMGIATLIYQGWRWQRGEFSWPSMLADPFPMSWFIYALLIWYLIFYVCYRYFEGGKRMTMLWLMTLLYLAVTIHQGMGYYWMSILPLPLVMTYVPHEAQFRALLVRHPMGLLVFGALLTLCVLLYATLGQYGMSLPVWGPPVYTLLPFSVLLLTYVLGGWKNGALNFLGRISYEFYVVHGLFVLALGNVRWAGLEDGWNALVTFMVCLLSVVAAGWILNALCSRMQSLVR